MSAAMPSAARRPGHPALGVLAVLVILFLVTPVLIVVPMSFSASSSLRFPPEGLSLRWYAQAFGDPRWVAAIGTSLSVAAASSTIALVLGTMAAYGLTRGRFRGRVALHSNFIAPMIIPTSLPAVALYFGLVRVGWLGSYGGLLLGHTLLGIPYVVLLMSAAIRSFDLRLEQVAFTLGANWGQMALRVLLPNLIPNAAAAWIFAFITSFDDVVVTAFLGGTYETVPKRMFNDLAIQINPSITAVATALIAVSVVMMGLAAWLLKQPSAMPAGEPRS